MSNNLYTTSSTTISGNSFCGTSSTDITGYVNPSTYITTTGTSPLYVKTDDLTGVGEFINKVTEDIRKEMEKNIKKEIEYTTTTTTGSSFTIGGTAAKSMQIHDGDDFKEVIEHVPGKVYEFEFWDGKHIKTICQEGDEFDFDYAFYLAAAKHMWGRELTLEGVLNKADELRTIKKWVKRVKVAKRRFFKNQEAELKAKERKEQAKEQHKKYIEKKKRRDERKATQMQDGLQKLITEAIKAAKEGE